MNKQDMIEKIIKYHTINNIEFSNTEYQKKSGDSHFNSVPENIHNLWYSPDQVSIISISKKLEKYGSANMNLKKNLNYIGKKNDKYLEEILNDEIELNKKMTAAFSEL